VRLIQSFGALDLDQQATVDQKIDAKCSRKPLSFKLNIDRLLPID